MKNPLIVPMGILICALLFLGHGMINTLNTANEYRIALIKFGHARYVSNGEGNPKFVLDTPPEGLTINE